MRVYEEIWVRRDTPERRFPTFPDTCPACGAHRTDERNGPSEATHNIRADYDCGGKFTLKSQIQTHTDKWWGSCPVS